MTDATPTNAASWREPDKEYDEDFAVAMDSLINDGSLVVVADSGELISAQATKLQTVLLSALHEMAIAQKNFMQVRNNRRSLPEEIMDVAQEFRGAEARAKSALEAYVNQLIEEVDV